MSSKTKIGCVVKGADSYTSEQGSIYSPGISAETVGSEALFLGVVTIPAGARTKAHVHERHESAFYLLSGESVELCTGNSLENKVFAESGDYLFIPANVPHVAVNRGTEPAVFVGVRNEPTAQESLIMLPELDKLVP